MKKSIIFKIILIIVIAGTGFYFWWQDQKTVMALNDNLPDGIKVTKTLFVDKYKVVNKIDEYEFKVPREWKGVSQIEYLPERTEANYTFSSLELSGFEGMGRIVGINHFRQNISNIILEEWAKESLQSVDKNVTLIKDKLGPLDIVKTEKIDDPSIGQIYFFASSSVVYAITGGSELYIRDIISNGKW